MFGKFIKLAILLILMSDLKQVIIIRSDVKMSKGKTAAQASHAAVEAVLRGNKKLVSKWRSNGQKKITLKVESLEQLNELILKAEEIGLTNSIIRDAGHTELEPGTTTCGAIGPAPEIQIDKITGELKPF
jgi:PTH2 family peptidyl-tRNA hydrolase